MLGIPLYTKKMTEEARVVAMEAEALNGMVLVIGPMRNMDLPASALTRISHFRSLHLSPRILLESSWAWK